MASERRTAREAGRAEDQLHRGDSTLLGEHFGDGIRAHAVRTTERELLERDEWVARELAVHSQHQRRVLSETLQALELQIDLVELTGCAEATHLRAGGHSGGIVGAD